MAHKCLILKLVPEQAILHIGFTRPAFDAISKRAQHFCDTGKLVSVDIKPYDPDKTPGQNALFHVCCRKIGWLTNMTEENIKQALKEAYGARKPNPLFREGGRYQPEILKSLAEYSMDEMGILMDGLFAESRYLRQYAGYIKLDLDQEYEDYKAAQKEQAK